MLRVLAIETSCDETAAAVVDRTEDRERPWRLRSSVVASQVEIHRAWGGVVPELASRQHVRDICGVVERALADAAIGWAEVEAIAVTQGPGLVGSLLVGVVVRQGRGVGRGQAAGRRAPSGRAHRVDLARSRTAPAARSGAGRLGRAYQPVSRAGARGSTVLLGRTRDDAAGEAYDKVAKLLGLGYPGGPIIDRLAAAGNPRAIAWPGTRLTNPDRNAPDRDGRFDFSFSGLKTAVLRHVRAPSSRARHRAPARRRDPGHCRQLSAPGRGHAGRSHVLPRHAGTARGRWVSRAACRRTRSLRREASARGACARDLPVFIPRLSLSTDNAAMIGAAGLRQLARGRLAPPDLNAAAALAL